ncbi:MAG: GNAT family N-acetyltransferase [Gordonia sp. (in: high G+C Gram-positive bacteria)]|uniref:GNAT family N-acetyltransferase n=1 Tax=Gordonia sp. (in: high G+C Gram-positive bacteria) TaxID=84139 RepID=UPI0039E2E61B
MTDIPVVVETVTDPVLADEIAAVAAVTFPLACPPHSTADDIAAHIAGTLSSAHFAAWITDPGHDVLVARDGADGPVLGYALLVHGPPTDDDVRALVPAEHVAEVSKMYVLPDHHGLGSGPERGADARPSHLLMEAALRRARDRGARTAWLGVNQENRRALRYYGKVGFTRAGIKTFDMNGTVEQDYVMVREL